MGTISGSKRIDAPPMQVWSMLSDLPSMGELSPENAGGRWERGVTGPAVGARFTGSNRQGRRRWSTRVQVTRCVPGEEFAFAVRIFGLPVADWAYRVTPEDADSCSVTETWTDRRGALLLRLGPLTTGVSDRADYTKQSIETTLATLKARSEAGGA